MRHLRLTILIGMIFTAAAFGQTNTQTENNENFRRHAIGSSLFVSFNYFVEDPADFYQLSYGYQFTKKDNLIIEAITWKYNEPLGTYDNSEETYPGKIRAYGVGAAYQRFHWKKLFTTVEATPFLQQFYDADDKKIQKGFQLYLQFIVGYRFEFFNKRLFVEPAAALKYWPVNTNFPDAFAEIEDGKPKHIFEPSLNFGIKF